LEELVRFDPHLIVGILGGSSGTTRDAFQLLADAQKYGARVALFGRKINHAENQLAFVHFLRLIVDGQIGPVDAVKAYHAVLAKLGIKPHRPLEDDLKITEQSMSYAGSAAVAVSVPGRPKTEAAQIARPAASTNGAHACKCQEKSAASAKAGECACKTSPVTESAALARSNGLFVPSAPATNGRPDFSKMSPADRLAYHRQRLGLGR
jgi:hypothetical protein